MLINTKIQWWIQGVVWANCSQQMSAAPR